MKIEPLTRKEILIGLRNEILDRIIRTEVDLALWTSMGVNPIKSFDTESTKNIRKQIQKNKQNMGNGEKLLEIIERKLEDEN